MSPSPAAQLLKGFGLVVYGPSAAYSMVLGALLPVVPVLAHAFSDSVAVAAVAVAMLSIGELVGSLPAGAVIARVGEKRTMILSGLIGLTGVAIIALLPSLAFLFLGGFLVGVGSSAFQLARHAVLTMYTPLPVRARAMSLLGGSGRLGLSVGPLATGALLSLTAANGAVMIFVAAILAATIALVGFSPEITAKRVQRSFDFPSVTVNAEHSAGQSELPGRTPTFWQAIRDGLTVLSTLGMATLTLSLLRSGRQAIIPLWGIAIGSDASTIAWVAGMSGALDFLLFYASGQLMDRYGRLAAALPGTIGLSAGFFVLWLSEFFTGQVGWWIAAAVLMGLTNGASSGIVKTLGSDVAPKNNPAPFLGAWNTLADVGTVAAPLIISAFTATLGIGVGALALTVCGVAGALGLWRWVPKYVPRVKR
ncbi:MAG: MFS transporter [Canibacter sp.]